MGKRTDTVVAANDFARRIFLERKTDPPYLPHMSLVYGDFDEDIKRSQIIPDIQHAISCAEKETVAAIKTIPVDSIEVWSTQGDVSEWYKVESIPLIGRKGVGN